jgi:hypothetical protein
VGKKTERSGKEFSGNVRRKQRGLAQKLDQRAILVLEPKKKEGKEDQGNRVNSQKRMKQCMGRLQVEKIANERLRLEETTPQILVF